MFDRNMQRVGFAPSACLPAMEVNVNVPSPAATKHLRGGHPPAALNTSDADYWRLIGWRRKVSSEDKDVQFGPAFSTDQLLGSRRLSVKIDEGVQKRDTSILKSIIELCKQRSESGNVVAVNAAPVTACSASCFHSKPTKNLEYLRATESAKIYHVKGQQPWQCTLRVNLTLPADLSRSLTYQNHVVSIGCAVRCYVASQNEVLLSRISAKGCAQDSADITLRDDIQGLQGSWSPCNNSCERSRYTRIQWPQPPLTHSVYYPIMQSSSCFSFLCTESSLAKKNSSVLINLQFLHGMRKFGDINFSRLDEIVESFSAVLKVDL